MKIVCPTCNKSYNIADGNIPYGKKAGATCKNCGGKITIDFGTEKQPENEEAAEFSSGSASSHAPGQPSSPETETGEFEFVPENVEFKGYAGFWKRFAAAIMDGFVLMFAGFTAGALTHGIGGEMSAGFNPPGHFSGIVLGWLYYALMESSSKQGTLGKLALGIKVTDLSGSKITFDRATGRHFSKIISTIVLLIGYIMVAFTAKKQGLHDMIAGCLVVNRT